MSAQLLQKTLAERNQIGRASIEIWQRQLENVRTQTRSAIEILVQRFSGVTREIDQIVDSTRVASEEIKIDPEDAPVSIRELFDRNSRELNALIAALSEAQRDKKRLIDEVRRFSEFTQELTKLSDDVAQNAFATKMLALNARIEAARAGEAAAGFEVVANEVRNLADSSAGVGDTISVLVEKLNGTVASVVEMNEATAAKDEASFGEANEIIERVMASFGSLNESLSDSAEQVGNAGGSVSRQIGEMLVALQFEDRTAQILEHVLEQMTQLREHLDPESETVALDAWLDDMEGSYTTREEKAAHYGGNDQPEDEDGLTFF